MTPQPKYTGYADLPFGTWIAARKIIRDRLASPETRQLFAASGLPTSGEIELITLLYGLTDADLDRIPAAALYDLAEAVRWVTVPPAVDESLSEFIWQGVTYSIDKEPREMSVLQVRSIEDVWLKVPDALEQLPFCIAYMVAPKDQPFGLDRLAQAEMIRQWPTSICYSIQAFFLRGCMPSAKLTRQCSELLALAEGMQDSTEGPPA
jgi:hypothetical protein